ncbi:MAG: heavy metal translocating P-type ATPase [Pseudomonadota bacterium]
MGKEKACYHCGLPVPPHVHITVSQDDTERAMCCEGCKAVFLLVHGQGLDDYYRFRETVPAIPQAISKEQLASFDTESFQQHYVTGNGTLKNVDLYVESMKCSACAWLIENFVRDKPGVLELTANTVNRQVKIRWDSERAALSEIVEHIEKLGYAVVPYETDTIIHQQQHERRDLLKRLGIAGLGMMQVMMYAVALYLGYADQWTDQHLTFIRWMSFFVATPIVIYSGWPIFHNAFSKIRHGQVTMDLPVAIALIIAYLGSLHALAFHTGDVYFDSVTMFLFFLLIGKYCELNARLKVSESMNVKKEHLPQTCLVERDQQWMSIPLSDVGIDEVVLVRKGDIIPVDGSILKGESSISAAIMTGESMPIAVKPFDKVIAGSVNLGETLQIRSEKAYQDNYYQRLLSLKDAAVAQKPRFMKIIENVAKRFIFLELFLAVVISLVWYFIDPSHVIPTVVAVLVVTCPCALSLAAPTAMTVATGMMTRYGLIMRKPHVMEALNAIDDVIFDKTGTLTTGEFRIAEVACLNESYNETQVLEIAAALEKHSDHPLAQPFHTINCQSQAEDVDTTHNAGIEGVYQGQRYFIGSANYIRSTLRQDELYDHTQEDKALKRVNLATESEIIATFELKDALRPQVKISIDKLQAMGKKVHVLTGDSEPNEELRHWIPVEQYQASQSPQDKVNYIKDLQKQQRKVLMIGDGLNDAPVLSMADVSIAMNEGSGLSKAAADAIFSGQNLQQFLQSFSLASHCFAKIRQNIFWAVGYNLTMVPLAVAGIVPPYLAALGMSLSSMVVLINALTIGRNNQKTIAKTTLAPA